MDSLSINSDSDIPLDLRNRGYKANYFSLDVNKWTDDRKETRIRDKYVKIKVRYAGNDLAVITALKTLYIVSYA